MQQTFRNSQVTTTWCRGEGRIALGGSVFCDVRAPAGRVLCGFYVSAVTAVLQEIAPDWTVEATACKAVGGGACVLTVRGK